MPINCSLEEFQTKFIHDDAPYSLPAYHRHKTQDFNVQSTPWVPQKINPDDDSDDVANDANDANDAKTPDATTNYTNTTTTTTTTTTHT